MQTLFKGGKIFNGEEMLDDGLAVLIENGAVKSLLHYKYSRLSGKALLYYDSG